MVDVCFKSKYFRVKFAEHYFFFSAFSIYCLLFSQNPAEPHPPPILSELKIADFPETLDPTPYSVIRNENLKLLCFQCMIAELKQLRVLVTSSAGKPCSSHMVLITRMMA